MNSRHRKTLAQLFQRPTRTDIHWADIESMLIALGADLEEGSGSRARFTLHGLPLFIHRPHPRPEAKRYQVTAVREFLANLKITVEE